MPYYIFQAATEGDLIGLRVAGVAPRSNKFERGYVRGFSVKSRSRLMKKIAMLRRDEKPLFVTLTYPDRFPDDWQKVKYDLHKFFIYLGRAFPGFGAIWKAELQKRGAYHFHILLFGCDYALVSQWIPGNWYSIAGGGDEKHLAFHLGQLGNEHCVQKIKSWRGVTSYASKYFTKEENETQGRVWGLRGLVPMSTLLELRIDVKAALDFRRAFRRWSGYSSKRVGFWAFGYSWDWLRFIDRVQTEIEYERLTSPPPDWYEHVQYIDFGNENPLDFF